MSSGHKSLPVVGEVEALAAGDFAPWLREMVEALLTESEVDVPCDGCTACCRSAQFVHIAPDERETLARVPSELLVPAPGGPAGHVVLGYDENGHCPLLVDDRCSIYEHRPRTCRTYDCRIFAAADIEVHEAPRQPVARRARRWRFRHPSAEDRERHAAVRAAAVFLRERAECFADGVPDDSTHLALLALKVHEVFLELASRRGVVERGEGPAADEEIAAAVLDASARFESSRKRK